MGITEIYVNKFHLVFFLAAASVAGCDNKEANVADSPAKTAERFLECAGTIKQIAAYTKSLGDPNHGAYDNLGTIYMRAGSNLSDPMYAAKATQKYMQLTSLKIDQMASAKDVDAIVDYLKSQLNTCSSLADKHKKEFEAAK